MKKLKSYLIDEGSNYYATPFAIVILVFLIACLMYGEIWLKGLAGVLIAVLLTAHEW